MKKSLIVPATTLLLASMTWAQTPASRPVATTTPAYTPVRWNEDYTYLNDSTKSSDFFEPIKYMPLGDDMYLSLGGQARLRYEGFNNENFGAVKNDWGYALQRYMLHADFHAGNFRVFAQGKSSMVDDGRQGTATVRASDADEADIQQLFVDGKFQVGDGSLLVRFGRQDLSYGAQRVIGVGDWTNTRRTFEGIKSSYIFNKTDSIDAFLVRPVIVDKERLNDGDGDTAFAGIYSTFILDAASNMKLEAYGLGQWKQSVTIDTDTYTAGTRLSGQPKPWDYDIEADYQFGQAGAGKISAYSFAAEGGYTFADVEFTPRAYLQFDYASGDDNSANPDKGTYNQLYPTGHMYFGYIDVIGRQNIINVAPGAELVLAKDMDYVKKLSVKGEYHLFWRADIHDGLYNTTGTQTRAAGGSDASFIGSEIDLLMNWQIDRHTSAYVGYSHFFEGSFIDDSAGSKNDINFLYAAVTYTF